MAPLWVVHGMHSKLRKIIQLCDATKEAVLDLASDDYWRVVEVLRHRGPLSIKDVAAELKVKHTGFDAFRKQFLRYVEWGGIEQISSGPNDPNTKYRAKGRTQSA